MERDVPSITEQPKSFAPRFLEILGCYGHFSRPVMPNTQWWWRPYWWVTPYGMLRTGDYVSVNRNCIWTWQSNVRRLAKCWHKLANLTTNLSITSNKWRPASLKLISKFKGDDFAEMQFEKGIRKGSRKMRSNFSLIPRLIKWLLIGSDLRTAKKKKITRDNTDSLKKAEKKTKRFRSPSEKSTMKASRGKAVVFFVELLFSFTLFHSDSEMDPAC